MKRTISVLVGLVALLAVALPAHAEPPNNSAVIGTSSGGCASSVTVDNDAHGIFGGTEFSRASMTAQTSTCAYVGFKARIQKCDGTTSTSAEEGKFNPTANGLDGPFLDYEFSCASAGIIGMYVRAAADNGSWTPDANGGFIYYFVGPPEGCFPAYCFL